MAEQENKIKLTAKEEAFCQNYLIDFNASKAARLAGYSKKADKEQGSYLLTKTNIQARITQLRKATGKDFNISRERLAQELARVAFQDSRKFFHADGTLKQIHELSDDEAAALAAVEADETEISFLDEVTYKKTKSKKIKTWDKIRAAEQLARMMGYNAPDKTSWTDPEGNAVIPEITINVIQPKKD